MPLTTMPVTSKRSSASWVIMAALTMLTPLRNSTTLRPAERAGDELHAVGVVAPGLAETGLQHLPFRLVGGHHRDARHGIEPIGGGRRRRAREQQAEGGNDGTHGVHDGLDNRPAGPWQKNDPCPAAAMSGAPRAISAANPAFPCARR